MERQVLDTDSLLMGAKQTRQREDERHEKIMDELRMRYAAERKERARQEERIREVAINIMDRHPDDPEIGIAELAVNIGIDPQTLRRLRAQRRQERDLR